jgi:hypothetical protein
MNQWHDLMQIASSIQLNDEDDTLIWQYTSSGRYSVQSLYAIINNRGVQQIFTPVVWKLSVPSRLHIFLWLLANNKVLTRDNLSKRINVDDKTCLFCAEYESVTHLFYECCVAKSMWGVVAELTSWTEIVDFESMAKLWIRNKNLKAVNVLTTAVIWCIWKVRNDICFQGTCWTGMRKLFGQCERFLRNWNLLNRPEVAAILETWARELELRSARPPRLTWERQGASVCDLGDRIQA